MAEGLYNKAAERWLLYALLLGDQPFMDACAGLEPRHFYFESYAEVYAALQASYAHHGSGLLPLVWEEMRRTVRPSEYDQACDEAADLIRRPPGDYHVAALSPTYVGILARTITELWNRREAMRHLQAGVGKVWAGEGPRPVEIAYGDEL